MNRLSPGASRACHAGNIECYLFISAHVLVASCFIMLTPVFLSFIIRFTKMVRLIMLQLLKLHLKQSGFVSTAANLAFTIPLHPIFV